MALDWTLICNESVKLLGSAMVGVIFASWYKDFKSKKSVQKNLFATLYSLRGAPLNYQSVLGINQVELIFSGQEEVLSAWRALRLELQVEDTSNEQVEKKQKKMNTLLEKMARATGQKHVIDSIESAHYYPKGFENQAMEEWRLRQAELKYYQNSVSFQDTLILGHQKNQENPSDKESK